MFDVMGSRKEGYAPQLQEMCHAVSNWILVLDEAGVGAVAQET